MRDFLIMANSLYIELVEFKNPGSDEIQCGFVAHDNDSETFYRSRCDWAGFKQEFPTPVAVLDFILATSPFESVSCDYEIVNGYPAIVEGDRDDELGGNVTNICFTGTESVY
jgi:hypothetical protein